MSSKGTSSLFLYLSILGNPSNSRATSSIQFWSTSNATSTASCISTCRAYESSKPTPGFLADRALSCTASHFIPTTSTRIHRQHWGHFWPNLLSIGSFKEKRRCTLYLGRPSDRSLDSPAYRWRFVWQRILSKCFLTDRIFRQFRFFDGV